MNDKAMDALANWRGEVHLGAATNEADELQRYRATGLTPEEIEVYGKRVVELHAKNERLEVENRYKQDECGELQAEITRLTKELQGAKANGMIQEHIISSGHNPADKDAIVRLTMNNAALTAENARLRAERDAAVGDLNLTANCDVCKHYDADENSCAKPTVDSYSCFEWRGTEGKA